MNKFLLKTNNNIFLLNFLQRKHFTIFDKTLNAAVINENENSCIESEKSKISSTRVY